MGGTPSQDVVPARRQADQAGCQFDGARQLLGHDLAQQLSADGQVGVPEPGPLRGQDPGHPVGPAPEPAAGIGVLEPLGKAVTDRHERVDSGHQITVSHPLNNAIPNRQ